MIKVPGIGELRHRVTFESVSHASDSQGGQTESWSTYATVWARIEPTGAREVQFGSALQYRRTHKVIIRGRDDLTFTTSMRMSFNSRYFQIHGIRRWDDERRFFLIMDVEEGVGS